MKILSCSCVLSCFVLAGSFCQAAAVYWTADSDGLWHVASNWDSNPALPGPADDVTIDRSSVTITVTHSTGTDSINSLNCQEGFVLSGGTLSVASDSSLSGSTTVSSSGILTGSGLVTFNGPATWSGGTMSGAGVKRVAAGKTLAINAGGNGHLYLDGTTLQNQGTISYTGNSYQLYSKNGAILENQTSGLVDLQNDWTFLSLSSGTQPTINNAGIFRKSAGTGISITPAALNNTGTVDVQTGTLSLEGGGTDSGTFTVASGATLQFNGGTHLWQGGVASSGAGVLKIVSGTVQADGAVTLSSGAALSGGILTGSGLVTFNGPTTWSGGDDEWCGRQASAGGKDPDA